MSWHSRLVILNETSTIVNPQNQKLKDKMALNSLRNLHVMACPTWAFNGHSICIDPIVVSSSIDVLSQVVMDVPNNINSTYAYVKINIPNQSEKTR